MIGEKEKNNQEKKKGNLTINDQSKEQRPRKRRVRIGFSVIIEYPM